jgi:hypothetical protein
MGTKLDPRAVSGQWRMEVTFGANLDFRRNFQISEDAKRAKAQTA